MRWTITSAYSAKAPSLIGAEAAQRVLVAAIGLDEHDWLALAQPRAQIVDRGRAVGGEGQRAREPAEQGRQSDAQREGPAGAGIGRPLLRKTQTAAATVSTDSRPTTTPPMIVPMRAAVMRSGMR